MFTFTRCGFSLSLSDSQTLRLSDSQAVVITSSVHHRRRHAQACTLHRLYMASSHGVHPYVTAWFQIPKSEFASRQMTASEHGYDDAYCRI